MQLIITYGLFVANYGLQSVVFRYSSYEYIAGFCLSLEAIVNAFLCYEFCQHKRLQRLITWATAQQRENLTSPVASLRKFAWGGWAAYLLFGGFYAGALIDTWKGLPLWSTVAYILLTPLAFGLMFYLCILWLWMNWVIHTTAQHWVQHRLDADSVLGVGGRDAGKELWEILGQMKEVSSLWAKNHAVRLVTTTAYATTLAAVLSGERRNAPHSAIAWWQMATTASLYVLVWLTAAVPGYVTDLLFSSLRRKLYTMWPEPDAGPIGGQMPPTSVLPVLTPRQRQPHSLTPLEARATALMQRAHFLQGREGMHFAFLPMTLARAITVGTVLGYAIVFATRVSN
jgi:hypothetical protein